MQCEHCGEECRQTDDITTGYALWREGDREIKVCYECAADMDVANAEETGQLFGYVQEEHDVHFHRTIRYITTWSGIKLGQVFSGRLVYQSNFGDLRENMLIAMRYRCRHQRAAEALGFEVNPGDTCTVCGHTFRRSTWYGTYFKGAGNYVCAKREKASGGVKANV